MMNKTVYYNHTLMLNTKTVKGIVIAVNGDRCVVRSREPYEDKAMFIFAGTSYRDVERIVKIDDLIIEGFDDAQSYINGIRSLTGTKLTNAKIIDMALRLTVKMAGYGIPLNDAEIGLIGKAYALHGHSLQPKKSRKKKS